MANIRQVNNVAQIRRKPEVLGGGAESPHLPSAQAYDAFKLPANTHVRQIKYLAATIDLRELGVVIPHCQYPERFEAGFRYGLAHNSRTDIKTQFRPLFSKGFCWAKMYYRKLDPSNPLAASGAIRGRG